MIQKYVQDNYAGDQFWFVDEVKKVHNQLRVHDVLDKKEYLSGQHAILNRPAEKYNGKIYQPRRIVLQYAKTILNFQTNYLLNNGITITGQQEIVDMFNKIYRNGKYNQMDNDTLATVIKYGNCYEYVYVEDGVIKSQLIDPASAFPVWSHENRLVSFIEFYTHNGIDYYTVFYEDKVEKYTNEGGDIHLVQVYNNLSGLPICYRNQNEIDPCYGRSLLDDIVPILDNMEDILSKFSDSFYKHHNPIPVAIGQQLTDGALSDELVGGGLLLDDGADFKMISNQLDYRSFETIYKTLLQSLYNISSTASVAMNNTDISNLSTVSIRLLFGLSDIQASLNSRWMRAGIEERFDKIRRILELQGVQIDDELYQTLGIHFSFARPQNETDIIADLKSLREIGGISTETMLSHNPYVSDVFQELQRIEAEGLGVGV